jgi:hypothetical protein
MTVLAGIGLAALILLTGLWAPAFWRVFVRADIGQADFDSSLALRFRVRLAGIALVAVWLAVVLTALRR